MKMLSLSLLLALPLCAGKYTGEAMYWGTKVIGYTGIGIGIGAASTQIPAIAVATTTTTLVGGAAMVGTAKVTVISGAVLASQMVEKTAQGARSFGQNCNYLP